MGESESRFFAPNSTTRWLLDRFVSIPILGIVTGAALVIFTAPAWIAVQMIVPDATPFLAGAILAFLIQVIGEGLTEDDESRTVNLPSEAGDGSQRVQLIAITALVVIPAAGTSLHVLAIALITETAVGYTAAAVALPFVLSPVDTRLGQRFGISFGAAGIHIGVAIIRVIAVLRGVRQELVTEAGRTAETLLFGRQRPQR